MRALRVSGRLTERRRHVVWLILPMVVALVLFLSTLQVDINASGHPYATDVGEIQNALPRWGLIHHSSYPLYSMLGSFFVTLLRPLGLEPAVGASLYSALWGVVTVGLVVELARALGASGPAAALGGLTVTLATSVWVDASLAEVHTMTLALATGALLFALRLDRSGARPDLLWMTFCFTQGVAHQRSVVLVAPALAILAGRQWRTLWRHLGWAMGVALLAPLTYLYLPLRVWTGATWVFGSPGTWEGFWRLFFDNRAARVVQWPQGIPGWWDRSRLVGELVVDDVFWPIAALSLGGLIWLAVRRRWREAAALAWLGFSNAFLTLIIWRGTVGDAQLAAKLPVVIVIGLGIGLALEWLMRQGGHLLGLGGLAALSILLGIWGWRTRPFVLSITREPSRADVIATAAQVAPPPDDRPTVLALPWGHDYWTLTYVQAYRDRLPGLTLVDHNANFEEILTRGDRLLTPSKTFYHFPVSWWEEHVGSRLYLSSAAPGVVELALAPPVEPAEVPETQGVDLENGIRIRSAGVAWRGLDRLHLTLYWELVRPVDRDYSVAVHLVAHDPPRHADDVLAQADASHPVGGWYPTSRWRAGEIVRDDYVVSVSEGTAPVALRVALYRATEDGFVNSPWLSLPLPSR